MTTIQLAKHASDVQRQRHWIHGDKYSGFNTSWTEYIRNLEQECVNSMRNIKEGTSAWKTMQRTAKFFGLIYNMNLNSGKAIDECPQMKMFLLGVEHNPLPSRTNSSRTKITMIREVEQQRNGQTVSVPVEEEIEVSSDIEEVSTGRNWIVNHSLRELANQIEAMLESSTKDDAYQTIIQLGHPRDRNGFLIAKRMADVYGKRDWFDILFPIRFEWGKPGSSLIEDWSLYKAEVDGRFCDSVLKGYSQLIIGMAMKGFKLYHYHTRLTDFIRVNEPDMIDVGAEWSTFRNIVDTFLGDQHKQSFIDTMFATENNVSNMMICAGVAEHDVVNAITVGATSANFRAISSNKNQSSQNQKNSKIEDVSSDSAVQVDDKKSQNKKKKSKKKEDNSDTTKNKKSTKDPLVCDWCSGNHKSWNCKNEAEKKKWSSKQCKTCNGKGHPQKVCPNWKAQL